MEFSAHPFGNLTIWSFTAILFSFAISDSTKVEAEKYFLWPVISFCPNRHRVLDN